MLLNQVSSINILQSAVRERKVCLINLKFNVLKLKNRQLSILQKDNCHLYSAWSYVDMDSVGRCLDMFRGGTVNISVEWCWGWKWEAGCQDEEQKKEIHWFCGELVSWCERRGCRGHALMKRGDWLWSPQIETAPSRRMWWERLIWKDLFTNPPLSLLKSNVLFGRRAPTVDLFTWHLKLKTFRPDIFPIQMS